MRFEGIQQDIKTEQTAEIRTFKWFDIVQNYGTIIAVPDKKSGDAINFYTYE